MKIIKVIETADELVNMIKNSNDHNYSPFMKLQIGEIKDSYVKIIDNEEYELGSGITFKSLFYAMCIYMSLNVSEVKINI